jgi:hypothetical protein
MIVAEKPGQWAWTRLVIESALHRAAVPAVMPGTVTREDFIAQAGHAYDVARERLRVLTEQAELNAYKKCGPCHDGECKAHAQPHPENVPPQEKP